MTIKLVTQRVIQRFSKMFQINKPVAQLDQLSSEQNCTLIRHLEEKLTKEELTGIDTMIYIKYLEDQCCCTRYEICQRNNEHRPTHFLVKIKTRFILETKESWEIL